MGGFTDLPCDGQPAQSPAPGPTTACMRQLRWDNAMANLVGLKLSVEECFLIIEFGKTRMKEALEKKA